MVHSTREPLQTADVERARPEQLVRSAERRKEFSRREAQRRLQQKETRWAPIAYGVFLAAVLAIFCVTYTTYAFSKYRGVILPGVYVDRTPMGGLSHNQAKSLIVRKLAALYGVPVELTFQGRRWDPRRQEIGVEYNVDATVKAAEAIGRTGPFLGNLLDRLPVHPSHSVPLLYRLDEQKLRDYLRTVIAPSVSTASRNASLDMNKSTWHVDLQRSQPGVQLDIANSEQEVHDALGSLRKQTRELRVQHISPVITDAEARAIQSRVETFLNHPPVMQLGKRVFVGSRYSFARMIGFSNKLGARKATIQMNVDPGAVHDYVAWLGSLLYQAPQNAKLDFSAGHVRIISPRKAGRQLVQDTAYNKILAALSSLKPTARLRLPVLTTQPAFDPTNPGSLGITTLLATGKTSFTGAPPGRTDAIISITKTLDNVVLRPGEDVSFNALVQTANGWADEVYADQERAVGGQVVPGTGGAMQQVATTFLRALYKTGLILKERHAHRFRLPWYEPPYGFDAVVSPSRNWDLVFRNNSRGYLILQTRVEPIRQEVFIYVYGPKLGWRVAVDSFGHLTNVMKPGPTVERPDATLSDGQQRQIEWPMDGGVTVLQRTITKPNGNVKIDEIDSRYDPRAGVVAVPLSVINATPQATPKGTPGTHGKPSPGTTQGPGGTGPKPQPTPTFNH